MKKKKSISRHLSKYRGHALQTTVRVDSSGLRPFFSAKPPSQPPSNNHSSPMNKSTDILFNNEPMESFFTGKKTLSSPLKLVINDLFSLSINDAKMIAGLITDISAPRPPIPSINDIFKRRPDKEPNKDI